MKIYVASKFENKEEVQAVQRRLIADGHTISHNWTVEDATGLTGVKFDTYMAECAIRDFNGVLDSDAVLLITKPDMRGAYSELGMALAWGRACYIVGRSPNIFYYLPREYGIRVFGTIDEAVTAINDDEFVD